VPRLLEVPLNVVDGKVFLSHGDSEIPEAITDRGILGSVKYIPEERSLFLRVVAELMAKDSKSPWRIAETFGDKGGGKVVEEEATQGFILFVERFFGR
jgi:hypothetical protein